MYDESIDEFLGEVFLVRPPKNLKDEFIDSASKWVEGHGIKGLDKFPVREVIQGCTQYIDDLYQRFGSLHIFKNDYKYHWRLNNDIEWAKLDNLHPLQPLLISCPFPYYGDIHPAMFTILEECERREVEVHVDAAWLGCTRAIDFTVDHPCISSIGVSLSKAGLGGNRIGVRFSRKKQSGPISLMNQFNMNQEALMLIGLEFTKRFEPGHWWNKYGKQYEIVCEDFNLRPTEAIHLAMEGDKPVGVRSLLRCLK